MTNRDSKGNDAAERLAEDDRRVDAENRAQAGYVIDPGIEIPTLRRTQVASSVTALINEDELHACRQRSKKGLQHRVIRARPTVKADKRRSLAHRGALRHQAHTIDVEVQPYVTDLNAHVATVCPCLSTAKRPAAIVQRARELVDFARHHGYRLDELIEIIEDVG